MAVQGPTVLKVKLTLSSTVPSKSGRAIEMASLESDQADFRAAPFMAATRANNGTPSLSPRSVNFLVSTLPTGPLKTSLPPAVVPTCRW